MKEVAGPSKKSRTSKKTKIIIPEATVKETKTSKTHFSYHSFEIWSSSQIKTEVWWFSYFKCGSQASCYSPKSANVIMGEGDFTKETTQPPQVSSRHGGGSLVSSFEIDGLLKACEARMVSNMSGMLKDSVLRILEKIDHAEHTKELRINSFNSKYVGVVKELTNVQNTLFVMDLKKVREDINLKLQELHDDMVREVTVVQNDYATLHKKVDIICDAVTEYFTLYESMSPQITQLSTTDNQQFGEVISMLIDLKESVLNPVTSSIITPEFLSQNFT
ncbi:unnamed protein product [Lactuca saligna]|uniref:Uncharacterized protein n=1 Tax=Lactuca saligna TaxID=75948 RepID=A0AA35ZJM0_LACSI|nr:unnamed protein product [Lactuca saligna]